MSAPDRRGAARLGPGSRRRSAACREATGHSGRCTSVAIGSDAETSVADTSEIEPRRTVGTSPSTAPEGTDPRPSSPSQQPADDDFPVTLEVPGWTWGEPADEKFLCSQGGATVLVTVRPASSHDAYLTDPDKASIEQYVSDVHDGVFATVNRMPDDHTTDVFALGAALQWDDQ